jgi:dTDP-glucose 4,6-dehydratase/UDP-glucuronate decarboxylase
MKKGINSIIRQDCLKILKEVDLSSLKDQSVLLTGSNGLLGSCIANVIYFANKELSLNCRLYCVSLHEPSDAIARLLDDGRILAIAADISKGLEFDKKIDYIFHAACYGQPKKYLEDKFKTITLNVDAVRSLLELAKSKCAKFMFFSSADVYGDIPAEVMPAPETYSGNILTTSPRAIYGESKRMGETICSIYRRDHDVGARIVRISHVYGPGLSINDERVLGSFIKKAIFEKEIRMMDSGSAVKTFGYISDVISMILKVMLHGTDFVYNVGGEDRVSILRLAEEVAKHCGNIPVKASKKEERVEHIKTDNRLVGLDISKYEKEFGKMKFVEFSDGIKRTVQWNIEEFGLKRNKEK